MLRKLRIHWSGACSESSEYIGLAHVQRAQNTLEMRLLRKLRIHWSGACSGSSEYIGVAHCICVLFAFSSRHFITSFWDILCVHFFRSRQSRCQSETYFLSSVEFFFENYFFLQIIHSVTPLACQTVWIQAVCKCYKQTTKVH